MCWTLCVSQSARHRPAPLCAEPRRPAPHYATPHHHPHTHATCHTPHPAALPRPRPRRRKRRAPLRLLGGWGQQLPTTQRRPARRQQQGRRGRGHEALWRGPLATRCAHACVGRSSGQWEGGGGAGSVRGHFLPGRTKVVGCICGGGEGLGCVRGRCCFGETANVDFPAATVTVRTCQANRPRTRMCFVAASAPAPPPAHTAELKNIAPGILSIRRQPEVHRPRRARGEAATTLS